MRNIFENVQFIEDNIINDVNDGEDKDPGEVFYPEDPAKDIKD